LRIHLSLQLWGGFQTSIGVDEMPKSLGREAWIRSGLADPQELDGAVLVVLRPKPTLSVRVREDFQARSFGTLP
jgi:hypothetical protein